MPTAVEVEICSFSISLARNANKFFIVTQNYTCKLNISTEYTSQ